jgi:hypothetical protein
VTPAHERALTEVRGDARHPVGVVTRAEPSVLQLSALVPAWLKRMGDLRRIVHALGEDAESGATGCIFSQLPIL